MRLRALAVAPLLFLLACPTAPTWDDDGDATDDDDGDATDDDDGACPDDDGDGVCNDDDTCPGGDDTLDLDNDGTPAWCDTTPEQVGEPDDLGSNSSHAVNFLLGTRHTLVEEGVLQAVGILARRAGPSYRIGIYLDADGPTSLVVEIDGGELVAGPQTVPAPEWVLAPGDYWLMGLYSAAVSIGEDGSGGSDTRYIEHEFAEPMPETWPEFDYAFPGPRINLWMNVGR